MEYSEIVLIALILLVVFCGAQVPKLIALFSPKRTNLESIKTVVSASKPVEMPHETIATVQQVKKAPVPVKKKTSVKKTVTSKKTATKKTKTVKKTAKK